MPIEGGTDGGGTVDALEDLAVVSQIFSESVVGFADVGIQRLTHRIVTCHRI
jgi:hypothetical protein